MNITQYHVILHNNNITYGITDALRYLFAISNLYDISSEEIDQAYKEKDLYLNKQLDLQNKLPDLDQPVLVIDIDDVLGNFREHFNSWLYESYGVLIDKNSTSYYSSKEVKSEGHSPEKVFEDFITKNELLKIEIMEG